MIMIDSGASVHVCLLNTAKRTAFDKKNKRNNATADSFGRRDEATRQIWSLGSMINSGFDVYFTMISLVVGTLFYHPDSLQYPAQFTLRTT